MKKLFASLILAISIPIFAGTFENILSTSGQVVWQLKPTCKLAASDTIGPIPLMYCKYFAVDYKGKRIGHKDTAIVDSGFKVRLYTSYNQSKTNLSVPATTDSVLNFFSADSFIVRTTNRIKGVALPVAPYYWFVFTRYDSNADTLDFKKSTGVIDTIMTFNGYKER